MVMDDEASVAAFHVAQPVMQLPVYRVNALAMSALLPERGTVLDLGSGSGRLLAHLAEARPDVRSIGTDLAETMLSQGRSLIEESRLTGRVELHNADITELPDDLPQDVDLVSTVWALHHLPSEEHLRRCLVGIAAIRERTGCAVWIFDFARLGHDSTFPAMVAMVPRAPARLCEDAIASERAAWSFGELRDALHDAGLGDLEGVRGKGLLHYVQAWCAPSRAGRSSAHATLWSAPKLPFASRFGFRQYRKSLASLA